MSSQESEENPQVPKMKRQNPCDQLEINVWLTRESSPTTVF